MLNAIKAAASKRKDCTTTRNPQTKWSRWQPHTHSFPALEQTNPQLLVGAHGFAGDGVPCYPFQWLSEPYTLMLDDLTPAL